MSVDMWLPAAGTPSGPGTDRDIVVRGLATGKAPDQTLAGDLNQGEAVTIGADDSVEHTMATMIEHRVKRLPVIDGDQLGSTHSTRGAEPSPGPQDNVSEADPGRSGSPVQPSTAAERHTPLRNAQSGQTTNR